MTNQQQPNTRALLYTKIHKVMEEIERVAKRGTNTHQGYSYVFAADVIEECRQLFIKHRLILLPSVQACEYARFEKEGRGADYRARLTIAYTIADADTGEETTLVYQGEGQDSGDKALYKSYTGAFKYFLRDTFMIPVGDDPESDGEPQAQPKQQSRQEPRQPAQRAPAQGAAQDDTLCGVCGAEKVPSKNGGLYCRPCWQRRNAANSR